MANERIARTDEGQVDVVAYLLSRGAVSRATAVPIGEVPAVIPTTWSALIMCGLVREQSPGYYYLAEVPDDAARGVQWGRFAKTLSFWFLILAIPVLLIELSRP